MLDFNDAGIQGEVYISTEPVSTTSFLLQERKLLDLAEEDGIRLTRASSTDGGTYHGACPVCGGTDRFRIQAAGGSRLKDYCECNQCSLKGDAADYLQIVRGLSKSEAYRLAGIDLDSRVREPHRATKPEQQVDMSLWSQQAARFLEWPSRTLESSKGESVLAEKGISLDTARQFGIRYNPKDEYFYCSDWGKQGDNGKLAIPAGLLIPISSSDGQVIRLICRREIPYNGNRYHEVKGGHRHQPLIAGNPASDHIFMIESFLDVVLLYQEAGHLAQFVAGGGTSFTPDQQMLESFKQVHLSMDNDEAGINATKRLKALIPTASIFPLLQGKDPSEAAAAGLNLRAWVLAGVSGDYSKIEGLEAAQAELEKAVNTNVLSVKDRLSEFTVKQDYVQMIGNEDWLFKNLVIKNQILVICAKSGAGKTTINFFFIAGNLIHERGLTVFYFDLDSPASDHKRMFQHAKSIGRNFQWINPLTYGKDQSLIREFLDDFVKANERLDDVVFFFDTLKKFIDMLDKKSVKPFFSLLRQLTSLGATIILLGHANKHRGADGNLIFEGVGDIQSDTDALLFFERITNSDGSVDITTVCDIDKGAKVRGLYEPITFHIARDRSVTLKKDVTPAPDFSQGKAKRDKLTDEEILEKIKDCLFYEGKPVSQSEIISALKSEPDMKDIGVNKIREILNAYAIPERNAMKEGQIFYSGGGAYNKKMYSINT